MQALAPDLIPEKSTQIDSKTISTGSNTVTRPDALAQPWPATLPDQVRAVAPVLERSANPLTLPALEACFKGCGPWKKTLPLLLQTLEAVGHAQRVENGGEVTTWRA